MKFRELLEKRWFANTFALCAAVILYALLSHLPGIGHALKVLGGYLKPVIMGLAIAYIVNQLSNFLYRRVFGKMSNRRARWVLSVALGFIIILAVFVIILVGLIPQLVESIANFVGSLGGYTNSLSDVMSDLEALAAERNIDLAGLTEIGENLLSRLSAWLPGQLTKLLNQSVSIGKSFGNMFVAAILAIYFLMGKESLINGVKRLLHACTNEHGYDSSLVFWRKCNSIMGSYIVCSIIDALIVGFVNYIFMKICGMNYAVMVSVIVGVTNLAPTFGPIIGWLIGGFILLLANPLDAGIFSIFTILLQTLDGYIIKPRLFGNTLGVSGLWILVGIIVGGRIFGVLGILLAIPAVAIIDFTYHEYILKNLEARKEKSAERKREA